MTYFKISKKMQALALAGVITLGVPATSVTKVSAATTASSEIPTLAVEQKNIFYNGKEYKFNSFIPGYNDVNGWTILYDEVDGMNSLHIVHDTSNLKPGAEGFVSLDTIVKQQGTSVAVKPTPSVQTPQVTTPTPQPVSNYGGFVPYVQKEQGKYENTDVTNKNNYVRPENSILTGKYLNTSKNELELKIREYLKKTSMTEAEAKDYLDICFSYAGKITGYIPGSVTIRNDISSNITFKTDSASYVVLPYSTIEKLMNQDSEFEDGYTKEIVDSVFWEMLRFVKEQDQIKYKNLLSKHDLTIEAEKIRVELGDEKFKNRLSNTYGSGEDDILNFSIIAEQYLSGTIHNSNVQESTIKDIDRIMTNLTVKYPNGLAVPDTINVASSTLKNKVPTREVFIGEIATGASTINNIQQLNNSISDYGFYVYNIYSNPKFGTPTETDKKIREVLIAHLNSLKNPTNIANINNDNLIKYLRAIQFGGGLTPVMINEVEKKDMYSLANVAMWYAGVEKLSTTPYSQEEWAKIKPVVLETAATIAAKNKVKDGHSVWSEAFAKELMSELNKKGIDITRIHDYIFEAEIKALMPKTAA